MPAPFVMNAPNNAETLLLLPLYTEEVFHRCYCYSPNDATRMNQYSMLCRVRVQKLIRCTFLNPPTLPLGEIVSLHIFPVGRVESREFPIEDCDNLTVSHDDIARRQVRVS